MALSHQELDRADWLLLLIDGAALDVDGPKLLDPVRIQKGMFLLSKRGPARDLYAFRPYNWGPFSRDIYRDLDRLVQEGLLRAVQTPGQTWQRYETTEEGSDVATELTEALDGSIVSWMRDCRRFLTERSFSRLLSDVYEAYPDMATKSLFK